MKNQIEQTKIKKGLGVRIGEELKQNYILYIMSIPVIVYFALFCYLPMFGLVIAFKDNYKPIKGILGTAWAGMYGFQNFYDFIASPLFFSILKNTILISFYSILFGFPAPIIFALMLNEIKSLKYKKVIQTITYLPHFISLVVICGMITRFFREDGILTALIHMLGGAKTDYMLEPTWFRAIFVGSDIWQGIGWGSIIYLSALSSIDQELYEAAVIDGAGKWKQIIHITLPGIASTIIILFIMRMGTVLSVGYEKVILLQTDYTKNVARVISSYVYEKSFGGGSAKYSLSSAVGIFQSVVNILFLSIANTISKKFSESSLF